MRSAAERPERNSVVVDVRELSPDEEEYDLEIALDNLVKHPDTVLDSARQGFAEFVSESDIDHAKGSDYDLLPIQVVGLSRISPFRYKSNSIPGLFDSSNEICQIVVQSTENPDRIYKPASIGYRCPVGHDTRIIEPIYDRVEMGLCGNSDCMNSALQTSDGTVATQVVKFEVEFDDEYIKCVASGSYTNDRYFDILTDSEEELSLTGIPRIRVDDEGNADPVFEVLYLDNGI